MNGKTLTVLLVLKEHSNKNKFLNRLDIQRLISEDGSYGKYKYDVRSIGSALELLTDDYSVKLQNLFKIKIVRGKCQLDNFAWKRGWACIDLED